MMQKFIKVADLGDLPPGGKLLIDLDGRALALFNVDGTIHAIDDICTHDGGPLAEGEFEGTRIRCPRHGAQFDVRTGKPLGFPAFEPVATHAVEVRDGDVLVAVDD